MASCVGSLEHPYGEIVVSLLGYEPVEVKPEYCDDQDDTFGAKFRS